MVAAAQLTSGVDVGDVIQNLLNRVSDLEQKITSPTYTVPNGSSPAFGTIGVGGGGIVLGELSSPPTGLSATSGADFEDVYIHATWTGPFDTSAVSYQVMLAKKDITSGIYSLSNVYMTAGLDAYIYDVDPNSVYGVRVYSVNAIGVISIPDPATGWVDVTTGADTTIPVAPTGLSGASGVSSVTVWWNENTEPDVAQGHGSYELQYSTSPTFTSPTTQKISGTVVSFTGLSPTSTYYFRVRAVDSSGNTSPYSSTLTLVPGGAGSAGSDGIAPSSSPTPTVTPATGGLIVKWTPITNADPVTYKVYVSTTTGFTPGGGNFVMNTEGSLVVLLKDSSGAALSYVTTYYVKVVATDADGAAPASTQASGSPTQVGAGDILANSITASQIAAGTITATQIAAGTITATQIATGTITADRLVAGTITVASGVIGSLDASKITTGTLSATFLGAGTVSASTIVLASTGSMVGGTNPTGIGAAQSGWILNGTGFTAVSSGVITFHIDASGNATFAGTLSATTLVSPTISGGTITGATVAVGNSSTGVTMDSSGEILLYAGTTYPGRIMGLSSSIWLQVPNNTSLGGAGGFIFEADAWLFQNSSGNGFSISWDGTYWELAPSSGSGIYFVANYIQSFAGTMYFPATNMTVSGLTAGGGISTSSLTAAGITSTGTISASSSVSGSTGTFPSGVSTGGLTVSGGSSFGTSAAFFGNLFFDGLTPGGGSALLLNGSGQVFYTTSSRRFKRNNTPVDLDRLRPILDVPIEEFDFKWDDTHEKYMGPMAEDVAAAVPELALFDDLGRPKDVKTHQGAWMWIPFIKELYAKIAELEAKVAA